MEDRLCPFLKHPVPCTQGCRGYLILLSRLVERLIPSQKLQDYLRLALGTASEQQIKQHEQKPQAKGQQAVG